MNTPLHQPSTLKIAPLSSNFVGTSAPIVSVVIPAHNGAGTLERTLESLRAQTFKDWEAIVVDDGSTDATADVANSVIARDKRIRLIQQPAGGVSRARNTGIASAVGSWLLFLDADDIIVPEYFQKMLAAADADPFCQAVICGYARVTPSGEKFDEYCPPGGDLFPRLAQSCLFAIHACVLRRSLVNEMGGFNTTLRTCEDWDLWQRIARSGVHFHVVPEVLAHYCMRAMSASNDATRMLLDAMRLLEQGHSPDPRVKNPAPSAVNGMPRSQLSSARLISMCWSAGLLLGQEKDAAPILEYFKNDRDPSLDPTSVKHCLFTAAMLPTCSHPKAWEALWLKVESKLDAFLAGLEAVSGAPDLARRTKDQLAREILAALPCNGPTRIANILATRVEITRPIEDVRVDPTLERVLILVDVEGARVGAIELPVCDGVVPAGVISDAIANELNWPILWKAFGQTIYPSLKIEVDASGARTIRRGDVLLAENVTEVGAGRWPRWHDQIGWTVFLQELWGKPNWNSQQFYRDAMAFRVGAARQDGGEAPITIDVASQVYQLSTPGKRSIVRVQFAGVPVEVLEIDSTSISAQQLLATINTACGTELLRLFVREAIIGRPLADATSYRARICQLKRARQKAPAGGALILGRHPSGRVGTSSLRRATLPLGAAETLREAAAAIGQAWIGSPERATSVVYDPDLLPAPRPAIVPEVSRFLQIMSSIRRRFGRVASQAENRKASKPRPHDDKFTTSRLPILMYHRVAPAGAAATSRWRVTPDEFEQQLKFLYDAGYYSVTFEDWHASAEFKKPFPGRAIILTFDDGYTDFHEFAWPILKKYGFSAYVFLVADRIGGKNLWDQQFGESLPLMNWEQIRELQDAGIHFGSHTSTHPMLTSLTNTDIVREAARSVAILTKGLNRAVTSFAYPFGDHDPAVAHLIGACGLNYCVTCRSALAEFTDPFVILPRLEVVGGATLRDFATTLAGT